MVSIYCVCFPQLFNTTGVNSGTGTVYPSGVHTRPCGVCILWPVYTLFFWITAFVALFLIFITLHSVKLGINLNGPDDHKTLCNVLVGRLSKWVSEWLLINANSAIFSSYSMARTSAFSMRWWQGPFVLD